MYKRKNIRRFTLEKSLELKTKLSSFSVCMGQKIQLINLSPLFTSSSELTREGGDGPAPFRSGAITPDGLIDEDFEAEIGTPSVSLCPYSRSKIVLDLLFSLLIILL